MLKLKLILFSISILYAGILRAQKIGAAEVYYEKLGQSTYLVTANVYRICSSTAMNKLDGFVIADTIKIPMSFTRVAINRIDDTCGNPCNIQNSKSNHGFERHTYLDTVDLNSSTYSRILSSGKCLVKFALHQNMRNYSFTNIQHNGMYYIDAEVNICLSIGNNRSPQFSFDPKFYTSCNFPFTYTPGVLDTSDYDSLSFELDAALMDEKNPVTYNSNYSYLIPMTPYCPPNPGVTTCRALPNAKPPRGFYFNYETCEIALTPTDCSETAPIKFKVYEWRKDSSNKFVKIGYVCREMMTTVVSSNNNPTSILSGSQYNVCDGNKLCFTIQTEDHQNIPFQNVPDTTTVQWNYGIPGAGFKIVDSTAREKEAQFCWNSHQINGNRRYHFGVKSYDKLCNVNLITKAYIINVKPTAKSSFDVKSLQCNRFAITTIPIDSITAPLNSYTFQNSIYAIEDLKSPVYTSNIAKDTVTFSKSGKYVIKTTVNSLLYNCPKIYLDTIQVGPLASLLSMNGDSPVCHGDSITLKPINAISSEYKYQWEYPLGNINIQDTLPELSIRMNKKTEKVILNVSDGNICSVSDTITLMSRGGFDFSPFGQPLKVCENDSSTIEIKNIKGDTAFSFEWKINGVIDANTGSSIRKLFKNTSSISLKVTDASSCSFTDSMTIEAVKAPEFTLPDMKVCAGNSVNIKPRLKQWEPGLKYKWFSDSFNTGKKDSFIVIRLMTDEKLGLEIENRFGCKQYEESDLTLLPLPTFNILSDSIFNKAHFIRMSTDKAFSSYLWSTGATTRNNDFWAYELGAPGTYTIWCEVTDSNGCKSKEQIKIHTDRMTGVSSVLESHFKIYPNPADAVLIIETERASTFRILSSDGRSILNGELNTGSTQVDVHTLAPGIYIFECDGKFLKFVKS